MNLTQFILHSCDNKIRYSYQPASVDVLERNLIGQSSSFFIVIACFPFFRGKLSQFFSVVRRDASLCIVQFKCLSWSFYPSSRLRRALFFLNLSGCSDGQFLTINPLKFSIFFRRLRNYGFSGNLTCGHVFPKHVLNTLHKINIKNSYGKKQKCRLAGKS